MNSFLSINSNLTSSTINSVRTLIYRLLLSFVCGFFLLGSNTSYAAIDRDAAAVVPVITIDDVILYEEEGLATLTISLSQPTTQDVSVAYTTGDASAIDGVDYVGTNNVATIPAGQTSTLITFPILDDATPGLTANFVVNLSAAVNGTIADPQGTVTILDRDAIVPMITIDDVILYEEEGLATLTISLSQPTTKDVSVGYTTGDISAIDGVDYIGSSNVAMIPAGQTSTLVTFPILDDATPGLTANFVVDLSAAVNGTIADAEGRVTILDRDVEAVIPMQLATQTTDIEATVNTNIDLTNFQAAAVEITLFPNPAVDRLNINLSSLAGQRGQLYLSNTIGQVVKTLSINEIDAAAVQLEVGQLTSGLYHLTVVANGQLITTEKVMIQQ